MNSRNGRLFLVYTRDCTSDWEPTGDPMSERAAVKEVDNLRQCGVQAQCLPVGEKPVSVAS